MPPLPASKLRRQETGKDLGAGIWHLVTPPLSLSPGNSSPRTPSLDSRNPAPGIPGPLRTCPFTWSPCTLTFGVRHLWSGSLLLCSLDESCLYSPGSLSLSLVALTSENLPLPYLPLGPTLIPGTAPAPRLLDLQISSSRNFTLTSPSPCLHYGAVGSFPQHTLGLSLPRCHRSGGEGDPARGREGYRRWSLPMGKP